MLNNRIVNIIVIVSLLLILFLRYGLGYHFSAWWYAIPVLIYLPFTINGAINVRSGYFMKVICEAATSEKVVALSFDDGPLPQFTPGILDILKKENIPAAFFCIGKNIPGNEALLKRIYNEGHTIGNHTYSHAFWFDMKLPGDMLKDMQEMDVLTTHSTGLQPRLFRPPYGVTNPNLARAVKAGGYIPVGWNIRSLDTVAKDEAQLVNRVVSQLQPGAVILLHDTCEITAAVLPTLISRIREQGYRFERIDKMLNLPAYV
ncbi:Peptidoglycan/xylan/chitin deacetylase, PgdA/CDA1 family [Chitinophaga terrae (ex Kim and Jung 2007)]|jgi:peptidoglycan/xylan/chitin deacetylase (PgdA/CDA1 family)|uniref:Peptidoglycan/xylan/chitin deacetylase, PgdA/CDA1 family n=1 Tax=Chitinophaga terrae (ex Kim and Jung 2007) TaxID=408074 RepID=A0A1H3ZWP7_9BACT|nr:polysaccharide deacetylase family protein [Chitinophaga terrae (ex Kim and Jung 2007)]MDQ0106152.1 peptidoglycan/xylan/chitin deacetylase (PgdA/CDA1 family) [Chitinophaga terrae (ex Kim and Jung 2007)]GEP93147.1 polysaccharide deacetylase [Chitinophaga terrae (ex Kim and Jung 2007)]SEA28127.1 Peptidoglycan/xylan/chitin deacetylase, PgdA/CDA1 family [Chitinophaga terrae (ex Kim and Jung 2007)]